MYARQRVHRVLAPDPRRWTAAPHTGLHDAESPGSLLGQRDL